MGGGPGIWAGLKSSGIGLGVEDDPVLYCGDPGAEPPWESYCD